MYICLHAPSKKITSVSKVNEDTDKQTGGQTDRPAYRSMMTHTDRQTDDTHAYIHM